MAVVCEGLTSGGESGRAQRRVDPTSTEWDPTVGTVIISRPRVGGSGPRGAAIYDDYIYGVQRIRSDP